MGAGRREWTDLLKNIQKSLEWYTPGKVKRVEIPKGNGKMRPLGIPTIKDRLIQQSIATIKNRQHQVEMTAIKI